MNNARTRREKRSHHWPAFDKRTPSGWGGGTPAFDSNASILLEDGTFLLQQDGVSQFYLESV